MCFTVKHLQFTLYQLAVAPRNCPAIEEGANSTVNPSTYKTDALEVGYTLTFSCPGPYLSYLSASPFMSCLDTGHWNSTVPSCIPVVQDLEKKINSEFHFKLRKLL